MKTVFLFFIVLSIGYTHTSAQSITVEDARKLYAQSMNDKSVCEAAYKKFTTVTTKSTTLLRGYKGAVSVAMSKHLKTVKEKIAIFNEGKALIEGALVEDAKNVELKFIRYTIQSNCPPALKYNKNIEEDKKFIIGNLDTVKNSIVRSQIKDFLLQSKNISQAEKDKLNAL